MKRRYWILSAATLLLSACGSAVGVGSNSVDNLASTRVKTSSNTEVQRAVEAVFRDEGFAVTSRGSGSMSFSKAGGRSADITWKTIGNDNPVMIEPTVSWRPDGPGMMWIGCQVDVVQESNTFGDTVRKPVLMGKSAYHGMLRKVKSRVEAGL